jgi:hypothetical protein
MASLRTRSAHRPLAYDALGFMGQAGYSEEADGVLPLCRTTWGDDKLLRAALAGRRGGPPPAHGWRGRMRLMAACHFGRLPRASLLLSNGAPLEQRDAFGGTAMAAAVVAGRSAVVSALRSAGAGSYAPLAGMTSSTLQGHTAGVWSLAVLPDGRLASTRPCVCGAPRRACARPCWRGTRAGCMPSPCSPTVGSRLEESKFGCGRKS